jgi:ferritin-like metal-binding protein YciE
MLSPLFMPPLNLQSGFLRSPAEILDAAHAGKKLAFGAEAIERVPGHLENGWRETLARVLTEEIRELHRAEVQLATVWVSMSLASTDQVLQAVFEDFGQHCGSRIQRLKLVGRLLGLSPEGGASPAMDGLLLGAGETIKENPPGHDRDASLVAAAQKIVYYLATTYCCARDFAELLDAEFAVRILQFTVDDEANANATLRNLAELLETNSGARRYQ